MLKNPTVFLLKYHSEIFLRNIPSGKCGVKGKIKNHIRISQNGEIVLDFFEEAFQKPPIFATDSERASETLRIIGDFIDTLLSRRGLPAPPYLEYVTDYMQVDYADGEKRKFVLDDMAGEDIVSLKAALSPLLSKFGLRLDIGEALPQCVFRYVQVRFENIAKEYSYFWDGGEIEPGSRVLVPFGSENERRGGTVVAVEYYRATDAPYPPARIKKVIRVENS